MFDERNIKWMCIYKKYIQVMFWVYVLAAIVCCICGWCGAFWMTDSYFLDGIIYLVLGLLVAYIHLVCNMVILHFLTNVQLIRENVEDLYSAIQAPKQTVAVESPQKTAVEPVSENVWVCEHCQTQNSINYSQCKKCGNYRA